MEVKNLNIYEKMSAISNELEVVKKDLKIEIGKGSYKAVGEGNILAAVKPLEEKYRVYSYPVNRVVVDSGFLEQEKIDYSTKQKLTARSVFERIQTTYRFVNLDNTSEYVDVTSFGVGIDSGDKSVGKAMTYADKYALMKAYKIETGDDPDQTASQEYTKSTKSKKFDVRKSLTDRCEQLHISLPKLAIFKGKQLMDLTDDDLKEAIAMKEAKLNG